MDLLKSRAEPSFGWFEAIVLSLYTILVGCVTYYHEPWSDEAQAWLIARDSSLHDIFLKRLHYEGTPGLWHLLLWIFCRLHMSYAAMHWATALIGVGAVYILLRYSPFPPLVRATLSFTFPLVFQTAIIARSYSLVPPLAFLVCIVLTARRNRPLAFAILVGLLANTSLIAFLLALGLVPLYLLRLAKTDKLPSRRSLLISGSALTLLFLFALYTAVPAPDISFEPGKRLASHPVIGHLLSEITAIPQPTAAKDILLPVAMKPAVPDLKARFLAAHFAPHSIPGRLIFKVASIFSLPFFAVSQSNVLAVLFYATLLCWQIRRNALITSLPLLVVLIGGHYLGIGEHHTSIIATAIIVALWLTWNRSFAFVPRKFDMIFQIVLLAVLIEQVAWTAHAAVYDIRQPFDGSKNAARFIIPKANHLHVASIGIEPLSIQPYASHNVFDNQSSTYWPWRRGVDPDSHLAETVAQHPDFILDGEAFTGDTILADQILLQFPHGWIYDLRDKSTYLREHGYRETHRFCGLQPAHFGFGKKTCEVIYEPAK